MTGAIGGGLFRSPGRRQKEVAMALMGTCAFPPCRKALGHSPAGRQRWSAGPSHPPAAGHPPHGRTDGNLDIAVQMEVLDLVDEITGRRP
jgi:hypothetical protein